MTDIHARIGKVIQKGRENVVKGPMTTTLRHDPAQVFAYAAEHGLDDVIIIGIKNGREYFSSSLSDGAEALWMIERCKKTLISMGDA